MTDKEIIIDGVDVSKCPDLLKEYLPACYCSTLSKENQEASCAGCFCLFKIKQYMNNNKFIEDLKWELKRKEQEREELKEKLRLAKQLVDWILKTFNLEAYDWLADQNEISTEIKNFLVEQEEKNEKLKSQVDEDYNYYTTELKTLRDIISNKEKRNAALFLTSDRYRKALEEIEKIIVSTDAKTRPALYDFEQDNKILDIINKAKGGE